MVFCSQCGTKLKDGAKFCSGCGAPQNTPAAAAPPPAYQPPAYQPPAQGAPTAPVVQAQPVTAQATQFKCQLPHGVAPGQVMQVPVPAGYPNAGAPAQFRVPEGAQPGGYVMVPIPATSAGGAGPYNPQPQYVGQQQAYGNYGGGYGYQQQQGGMSTGGAIATGAVAGLGGYMVADALFDGGGMFDGFDGGGGDW